MTACRRAAALIALLACIAVSGCSGDDEPAEASTRPTVTESTGTSGTPSASAAPTEPLGPTVAEVFRTARAAALSAASAHVTGTVRFEGEPLKIDVEGVADGANQTVFITTEAGGTSEVVMVDGRYWLGGDEAFWAHQTGDETAGRAMVGKYVPIAESDATELGSYTLRGLLTDYFQRPEVTALESDATEAVETDLDGRPAYLLGDEGGPRLWVAADGSGTVLRAVGPTSAPSDLAFRSWGRARTFTPPPASVVVEG
jgi:hypothetical protein